MSYSPDQPDFTLPTLGPISKESRLEWRSTLNNNGTTPIITAMFTVYRGKFFPRGCRGFIDTIEVYCDNPDVADRDVIIRVSIEPGMGEVFTVNLTVPLGAAPAWRTVNVQRFWNYDSLFVWATAEIAVLTTRIGYDTGKPYDAHYSADMITWTPQNRRYWIIINFACETSGDVPVSGTVNTVQIPAIASQVIVALVNVPSAVWTPILTFYGAGRLIEARLEFPDNTVPSALIVYSLGLSNETGVCYEINNRNFTLTYIGTSGRNSVGEFYQEALPAVTRINYRGEIEFRQFLTLRAFQLTGAPIITQGNLYVKVIR